MRIALSVAAAVFACAAAADAEQASGSGALALGALVGEYAPLANGQRAALRALLDGKPKAAASFHVNADRVMCRASNVDITAHRCELVFGKRHVALTGRKARELYATMQVAGVRVEGAAGSLIAQAERLDCLIEPAVIAERAGGGARCGWSSV